MKNVSFLKENFFLSRYTSHVRDDNDATGTKSSERNLINAYNIFISVAIRIENKNKQEYIFPLALTTVFIINFHSFYLVTVAIKRA